MIATAPISVVRREDDLAAVMRDGTVLGADVYRPQRTGPFPVLMIRTPYDKRNPREVTLAEQVAAHGYIVVVQDIRGRYASDGDFDPFFSITTGNACIDDGYDTVEWAAGLPDSTNEVGTFGVSYMAFTQWKLAQSRPPHLRAMFVSGMSADSRSAWPGIFTRDRQLQWAFQAIVPDTRVRLGLPGPKTREEATAIWEQQDRGKWLWWEPMISLPREMLGGIAPLWERWLTSHNTDWHRFAEVCPEIDIPIYHQTGWYDRQRGTIDLYNTMLAQGRSDRTRRSQKLLIGPWTHGLTFARHLGNADFGPEAEVDTAAVIVRWFDHWLKGIDTGQMDEAPIRLFVMGENRWRDEQEWPLARTVYTDYYFRGAGDANTPFGDGALSLEQPSAETPDRYVYDPRDPVMSVQLPNGQAGPGDASVLDDRRDILVYQTPPLDQDVEVTGPLTVTLFAASTALDTDWTARLVDVSPDGAAVNVTYGIVRARYRDSWEHPTLLEPGQVYEYAIALQPTSIVFKAGHRIRVDVSSSDFPAYDRNHNTGLNDWEHPLLSVAHQVVFHDTARPSRVTLPIIPRS
jgi:uncharacterized protein